MDIEKAKINLETAKIEWSSLQRFFAAGTVLRVCPTEDLTAVARLMSEDNTAEIKRFIDSGKLAAVSDSQAVEWVNNDSIVWSVVVKPYVLVQDVVEEEE